MTPLSQWSAKDRYGMPIHWRCRITGHFWSSAWNPVGHIENAVWRYCLRGCGTGQMRYVDPNGPDDAA